MTWTERALCKSCPTLFMEQSREEDAVKVCARCPVTAECLADALATVDLDLVRGGKTPAQLRQLLRYRGRGGGQEILKGWPDQLMNQLLAELAVPRTRGQLARITGLSVGYVGRALKSMVEGGLVTRSEKKKIGMGGWQTLSWFKKVKAA